MLEEPKELQYFEEFRFYYNVGPKMYELLHKNNSPTEWIKEPPSAFTSIQKELDSIGVLQHAVLIKFDLQLMIVRFTPMAITLDDVYKLFERCKSLFCDTTFHAKGNTVTFQLLDRDN